MPSSPASAPFPRNFIELAVRERAFLTIVLGAFLLAAFTYQTPSVAMWVGFAFAGYSAVANDSIQTLGTFIASNRKARWWILWLYIGGIFIVTMLFGWFRFDGDISWQRLTSKGFDIAPQQFSFLQVAAPLFLLILTRLRMPVSTSILLLSCFATSSKGIADVLMKSVGGYGVAFIASLVIWGTLGRWMQNRFTGEPHPAWRVGQFITTGMLWAVWLAQDAANIAVYLPRTLNAYQAAAFIAFIFFGLGILFFQRGEKIQEVVEEKSAVADVRPAAVIDLVYGLILAWKMTTSTVPMSTTWVFIGLLGGRELALTWSKAIPGRSVRGAIAMMTRDLTSVVIGLVVSLGLAVVMNDVIRHAWMPSAFSPEQGACVHINSGAVRPVSAAGSPEALAAAPVAVRHHTAHAIERPGGPQTPAWVAFESSGATHSVFVGSEIELRATTADGTPVPLQAQGSSDVCAPVDAWFTGTLPEGTIFFELGPGPVEAELFVIE